ncbi:MAG TPA: hypothetical protein VEJ22_02530, partial [Nitrospirota bacterium]|nr:hypothetical protein [Nitrospirota bacterium]
MNKFAFLALLIMVSTACATLPTGTQEEKVETVSPDVQAKADADYHFMVGSILEQDGHFDAAQKEYEQAYRLDSSSAEIALSLAALSLRKGHLDQATLYAQKAAELQPDRTQTLMLLAGIYTGVKKYDDAMSLYRRIIS